MENIHYHAISHTFLRSRKVRKSFLGSLLSLKNSADHQKEHIKMSKDEKGVEKEEIAVRI